MSSDNWSIPAAEVSAHNLDSLSSEVRRDYFPDAPAIRIEWGKNPGRRRRRSIRLGSYHRGRELIRIHPHLNSSVVPSWFIQSIIYHEYLHHILGPSHDRRFHRQERRFRFHSESKDWLAHNLLLLLGIRQKPRRATRRRLRRGVEAPERQMSLFGDSR
jgi:hypothetical protein